MRSAAPGVAKRTGRSRAAERGEVGCGTRSPLLHVACRSGGARRLAGETQWERRLEAKGSPPESERPPARTAPREQRGRHRVFTPEHADTLGFHRWPGSLCSVNNGFGRQPMGRTLIVGDVHGCKAELE